MIIADDTCDVEMAVTDLLGQAEHGFSSPAVLVTTSKKLAEQVPAEIERQLADLATAEVARKSWQDYGQIILCSDDAEMIRVADDLAFEHVQVITREPVSTGCVCRVVAQDTGIPGCHLGGGRLLIRRHI